MASTLKIGFLGAGKMASALAKGFVAAKIVPPRQIIASDVMEPARAAFTKDVGGSATDSNLEVLKFATVLILAAKIVPPRQIIASDVMEPARAAFTKDVGGSATDSNLEVLKFATVLILAV